MGPIVASNSFSLDGVMESGSEPITIRLEGLPEDPDFVATTRLALLSEVDEPPGFRSAELRRECYENNKVNLLPMCNL